MVGKSKFFVQHSSSMGAFVDSINQAISDFFNKENSTIDPDSEFVQDLWKYASTNDAKIKASLFPSLLDSVSDVYEAEMLVVVTPDGSQERFKAGERALSFL